MLALPFFSLDRAGNTIDYSIAASDASDQSVWIANGRALVSQYDLTLTLQATVQAYSTSIQTIKHVQSINAKNESNTILCIGLDESDYPVLKQFVNMKLTKSIKIQLGKPFPVTAMATFGTLIAFGLENGVVLVMGNEPEQLKFTKLKLVHEASASISGLGFVLCEKVVSLFVATLSNVAVVDLSAKEKENVTLLDNTNGADYDCACVSQTKNNQMLYVSRKDVIHSNS